MIRKYTISQRLKLLISLSLLVIALFAVVIGNYLVGQLRQAEKLQRQSIAIQKTASIIHNLQKERGFSSGFLGSQGTIFKSEVHKQRTATNRSLANASAAQYTCCSLNSEFHFRLTRLRQKVDSLAIPSIDAFDEYTELISSMRADYLAQVITVAHFQMRNQLQAYTNLMATKEALGQMRGAMAAVTSKHSIDHQLYLRISHAKAEFDIAQDRFLVMADPIEKKRYETIKTHAEFALMFQIIDTFLAHPDQQALSEPKAWFELATEAIDNVYRIENDYFVVFNTIAEKQLETARMGLVYAFLIFILLIAAILLLGQKIAGSIEKNVKLLDEYKNAVDRSSIVSKTTPKGIITYVNEPFCEISGYKQEELIGKNHSIVRHPDMPSEVFREMWNTLLRKRPWSGIVKNRKKDGSPYWVNATINPILDHNDDIEEFIAIRNDITETILLHEELGKTQQDMIIRIGEVGETRSRETGNHVRRVAEYSRILATKYGLTEDDIRNLTNASPMHDIGKIGIPDSILQKPGPLDSEEWEIMRTHSETGYRFFKDSDSPLLKAAAIITYEHHEKWDGSGYPRGLEGNNIHIFGRITALADVFDALGSDRCYKKAWENEKIFELFHQERGRHFDPALVDIFFEHLDEFLDIQARFSGTN